MTSTSDAKTGRSLLRLRGSVQEYEWGRPGSISLVAKLAPEAVGSDFKGKADGTYAEVWMGTHESGPAHIFSQPSKSLSSIIESDPEHYLGTALLKKWPNTKEVPFLFKILSIAKALPLQAHPDKDLGSTLHSKDPKEFVDANHKPEIAVAVGGEVDGLGPEVLNSETQRVAFTGFVGFQPLEQIAQSLKNVEELRDAVNDAAAVDSFTASPSKEGLKRVYTALLTRGKEQAPEIKELVTALVRRVSSAGWGAVADESTAVKSKIVVKIHDQYPGDVGVFAVPFFMNLVRLKKGESVYIGADEVHAYLEGDIIECMAVSDNVVNSAFVPPEERNIEVFTEMLTYTSREASHWNLPNESFERSKTGQTTKFSPPLEEFDVLRSQLTDGPETILPASGPTIGIVTSGKVKVAAGGESLTLPEGGIIYVVPGAETTVTADGGQGEVWWASCSL